MEHSAKIIMGPFAGLVSEKQQPPRMRACFDKLPKEAQDDVLRLIEKALLWRGWDRRPSSMKVTDHATEAVAKIAEILADHGMAWEEYT